jgi:Zn-dependent protease with chaperone function
LIYGNLIYLLVVVLVLSTHTPPEAPQLAGLVVLPVFAVKALLYQFLCRHFYSPGRIKSARNYFAVEQKLSILAIVSLIVDVHLLDSQYYLSLLPLASKLPIIAHLGGVFLFFGYLALQWQAAATSYGNVFGRRPSTFAFLRTNLRLNGSIILPWVFLSLISDLLQLVPLPAIKSILASPWGEPLIFLIFFLLLSVWLPKLVVRLWDCKPLPAGPTRAHIEGFCRSQHLEYADIMVWPIFEGQVLTAGVMGMTRKFRYLLVTPALLQAMSPAEVEAVMAHEIGHVKRRHLQLYLLFFLGFGLLAQLATFPLMYALLSSDAFYRFIPLIGKDPGNVLAMMSTVLMFLLMIVYFRYIFGFFIRNFERQADLYVFKVMGSGALLVQVLEKIAWLSGKIRDLPSWHHFGIGQRVDYLERCEAKPALIAQHDRKVKLALLSYVCILAMSALLLWKMPADLLEGAPKIRFAEAVIRKKIVDEPMNPLWYQYLVDLQYGRKSFAEAISAYEKSLTLAPETPEVLNNLAWLLLTADNRAYANPLRALELARQAVILKPQGHIFDTLALAYWLNGHQQRAIEMENQAIQADPANQDYYLHQMRRFAVPFVGSER